jgi:hypothetical protein
MNITSMPFIVSDIQLHGLVRIVIREETNGLCYNIAVKDKVRQEEMAIQIQGLSPKTKEVLQRALN